MRPRPLSALPFTCLVATLAVASFIASCSGGTDPGPCEVPECFRVAATMTILEDIAGVRAGRPPGYSVDARFAYVFGWEVYNAWVDAGTVTLNGVPVHRIDSGHHVVYTDSDSTIPILPPPMFNVWKAPGRQGNPAIDDSIQVPGPLEILAPKPGDTIDAAEDIVVRWTPLPAVSPPAAVHITVVRDGREAGILAHDSSGTLTVHSVEQGPPSVEGVVTLRFRREIIVDRLILPRYRYQLIARQLDSFNLHLAR